MRSVLGLAFMVARVSASGSRLTGFAELLVVTNALLRRFSGPQGLFVRRYAPACAPLVYDPPRLASFFGANEPIIYRRWECRNRKNSELTSDIEAWP